MCNCNKTEERIGFFETKKANGDQSAKLHLLVLKNKIQKGELCSHCADQASAVLATEGIEVYVAKTPYMNIDLTMFVGKLASTLRGTKVREIVGGVVLEMGTAGTATITFIQELNLDFETIAVRELSKAILPVELAAKSILSICNGKIQPHQVKGHVTFPAYLGPQEISTEGMKQSIVIPIFGAIARIFCVDSSQQLAG